MRTTVTLDADAFHAAKAKAAHEGKSLGKAISELILQALRPQTRRTDASGAAVFRSGAGLYTSAHVEAALDDE